jgi:hypothetical protein
MVGTEAEDVYLTNLPDGFRTTFKEGERLRRILDYGSTDIQNDLQGVVEDYNGNQLTEQQLIRSIADQINTSFLLPERTIELPGLQLALDPDLFGDSGGSLLARFAALYKDDANTPTGEINDAARAQTDDLVFTFATPEVYNQINDNAGSSPNFIQSGLTGGDTLNVIGQGGVDTGVNTTGNSLTLDDDEMLFFTGDFIDVSDGKSVVTATSVPEVDSEDFGRTEALFNNRLSGAHLATTQGFYATDTVDVDAKVYEDGDAELIPVAFYLADGSKAPDLV